MRGALVCGTNMRGLRLLRHRGRPYSERGGAGSMRGADLAMWPAAASPLFLLKRSEDPRPLHGRPRLPRRLPRVRGTLGASVHLFLFPGYINDGSDCSALCSLGNNSRLGLASRELLRHHRWHLVAPDDSFRL